jgi:Beta-lactamase enzyme family
VRQSQLKGHDTMRKRLYLAAAITLIPLVALILSEAPTARADDASLSRTITVEMKYVRGDNYKNRLINAQAAFNQMNDFFGRVEFKRGFNYSFLRDVLQGSMMPEQGYVNTPKGYAFGACGASSVLNKLVQTAMFRDSDGKEKNVFQTIMIWTWKGDKTYGQYGATIFLDPSGVRSKDYIWHLNPAYDGPPPKITAQFDMAAETVTLTMAYGDEPPATARPKATAVVSAPTAVPPSEPVAINGDDSPDGGVAPSDNSASANVPVNAVPDNRTKSERTADLSQKLKLIIGSRKFGVSVMPVGDSAGFLDEIGVNQDTQLFVASAFKGPLAMYFFENVDKEVWSSVPVRYWNAKDADSVPAEYRTAWLMHHDILKDVYWMTVYSENDATGDTLMYVYQNTAQASNGENPIIAFNNWSRQAVGIGPDSGLHMWLAGKTVCKKCVDERYGKKFLVYGGKVLSPNNTYSPRDLAQFYTYLATKGRQLGYYDIAHELLSTLGQERSMLEFYTNREGIKAASKDGFVGPYSEDSDGFYISTDAGLLTMPDGAQYAVAFMAFDAGDLMANSITTVLKSLPKNTRTPTMQGEVEP